MAYGLDVTDLIYTDENLYDLGTLEDYTVDLDVADGKDFELEAGPSADFSHKITKTIGGKIDTSNDVSTLDLLIPMHGFWYIDGTEFGGIVDRFETNNESYSIKYKGRSWRGILASHILTAEDSNGLDLEGSIADIVNYLILNAGCDDLFVCEQPDIDNSVNDYIDPITVYHGANLYDAITAIARSIFFSYNYIYKSTDKKVHIVPILSRDYTDYMTYGQDNTLKFEIGRDFAFTNHYILTSIDAETNERWTIHIFLDEYKIIQPYSTVDSDNIIRDSEYILDQSQKVLSGVKEIAQYYEFDNQPIPNYELLLEEPEDWSESYYGYFRHRYEISDDTLEITGDTWSPVEPEETPEYTLLSSEPDDWNSNFANYYYRSWSSDISDFDEIKAYIVGETLFADDWLSDATYGDPLTPEVGIVYTIETPGDYYHSAFEWSGYAYVESDKTYESPHWSYDSVGEESETEPYEQVTVCPEDWVMTYSNFYYKSQDELIQYQASDNAEYYVKTTVEPSDWNTSYSNYYRYAATYDTGSELKKYYTQYGSGQSDNIYYLISEKPIDWDANFSNYYYHRVVTAGEDTIIDDYQSYSGIDSPSYSLLSGKPSDWNSNYSNYYYHVNPGTDLMDEYIQYGSGGDASEYILVEKEPDKDYWKEHFSEYYYPRKRVYYINKKRSVVTDYISFASKGSKSEYIQVIEKPSDWDNGFGGYYYRYQTGIGFEYQAYSSTSKPKYVVMKKQPSDWKSNYGSYFVRKVRVSGKGKKEKLIDYYKGAEDKDIRYVKVTKPKGKKYPEFKANKYFINVGKTIVPKFNEKNTWVLSKTEDKVPKFVKGATYVKRSGTLPPAYQANNTYMISQGEVAPEYQSGNTYIQMGSTEEPPAFDSNNTYLLMTEEIIPDFKFDNTYLPVTVKHAPEFKQGSYYRKEVRVHAPEWMENTFYLEELDHYAGMIESLKDELATIAAGDTQKITLDDYDLDIGDLVGGKDDVTGLEITQEVKNMVVKIESGIVNIDYTIGDLDVTEENYQEDEEEGEEE